MYARCWPVLMFVLAAHPVTSHADDFQPRLEGATLKLRRQNFPQMRIESAWQPAVEHNGIRYRVDDDAVVELEGQTQKVARAAQISEEIRLRWHGAAQGVGFLTQRAPRGLGSANHRQSVAWAAIQRLDLRTMKWLPPLDVAVVPPADSPVVKTREAAAMKQGEDQKRFRFKSAEKPGLADGQLERGVCLCDVLVTNTGAAVLSSLDVRMGRAPWHAALGFQLSFFAPQSDKPQWTRWIEYPDDPQQKSALTNFPSIASLPDQPAVARLTQTKFGTVVCLPDTDQLLGFSDSGEQVWQLPRVWEFERWYVGSGQWSIDRFGFDADDSNDESFVFFSNDADSEVEAARRNTLQEELVKRRREEQANRATRRERFYKDFKGWIIAGPVKVPTDGPDEERLHVAVARTRIPFTNVAAPECFIYELTGEGGFVEATTAIPRPVYPRPHIGLRNASVWTCEGGSLARVGSCYSYDEPRCPVEWFREYRHLVPWDDWDGETTSVKCATTNQLFRTGFKYSIADQEQSIAFRINVVDLDTGLAQDLTLAVPFEGRIPEYEDPPIAQSESNPWGFRQTYRIAIDELAIDDTTLCAAIRTGKLQTRVSFDINPLLKVPEEEEEEE